MVSEVKPVHPLKEYPPPIEVTDVGIVIELNPVQFLKAAPPIEVNDVGKVMEVNVVFPT